MSTHQEAAAALHGLHGKFAWSIRDPPMVVTWMDTALQDPARQHRAGESALVRGPGAYAAPARTHRASGRRTRQPACT